MAMGPKQDGARGTIFGWCTRQIIQCTPRCLVFCSSQVLLREEQKSAEASVGALRRDATENTLQHRRVRGCAPHRMLSENAEGAMNIVELDTRTCADEHGALAVGRRGEGTVGDVRKHLPRRALRDAQDLMDEGFD